VSSSPRSLTIDEALLRRMARDAAIYALTRPWAIVMWAALTGALVLSILNLTALSAAGSADLGMTAWMPAISIALMVYAVVLTVVGARRAVRAAMPPGTVVWAVLGDEVLRIGAGHRTSEIRYETFQGLRAGADAVVLRLRGASAATAVPRALLTDEEIALLRSRIG
jgi:hypothetical protein